MKFPLKKKKIEKERHACYLQKPFENLLDLIHTPQIMHPQIQSCVIIYLLYTSFTIYADFNKP